MSNQTLKDDYINKLFDGTNFGEPTNGSVEEKRKLIKESLRNQLDGFWTGRTMYHILIDGGFLKDAKTSEPKELTALGRAFLQSP